MTEKYDEILAQIEIQSMKHRALMGTLTVPQYVGEGTFTNRRLEAQWVKSLEARTDGDGGYVTGTGGFTAWAPKKVFERLSESYPYIIETRGSMIVGWIVDGIWFARKSDQQLEAEHQEMLERFDRERRETLKKNQERWQADEDALPEWLKERIRTFHERGGEDFKINGWGYELMVCQLAEEYAKLGDVIQGKDVFEVSAVESEKIKQMSREFGTSGNQHGAALSLAKMHLNDLSLKNTPGALAPLTGKAFYEKD